MENEALTLKEIEKKIAKERAYLHEQVAKLQELKEKECENKECQIDDPDIFLEIAQIEENIYWTQLEIADLSEKESHAQIIEDETRRIRQQEKQKAEAARKQEENRVKTPIPVDKGVVVPGAKLLDDDDDKEEYKFWWQKY